MEVISTDDLRKAYVLGRSSDSILTPELLQQFGWSNEKILKIVNALIQKRLCVYQRTSSASGKVCVKVREENIAQAIRTLSVDEYAVYCAVEGAGNVGAWTYDICKISGLPSHVVQAAVKALSDTKGLIKPLKSIRQRNRKMYILANLEPSKEIIGGTFYKNAELDEALVEKLREQILVILKNNDEVTFAEIMKYVNNLGFATKISLDDLKLIMRTLELEQEVSQLNSPNDEVVFTWNRWPVETVADHFPCASCPVRNQCIPFKSSKISPHNCQYFSQWLSFEPTG